MTALKMDLDAMRAFLAAEFPQIAGRLEVEDLAPMRARLRLVATEADLRPGGTVSGPAMFRLADVAFYVATLGMIGPVALAVTTGATINFMRRPGPGALVAEARVLKLGRSLSVGDVLIRSDGQDGPVAQATMTYSIPPTARNLG